MLHELKKSNSSIKTNNFLLTLHALVLALNLASVIAECLPKPFFTDPQWTIVEIILYGTETIS